MVNFVPKWIRAIYIVLKIRYWGIPHPNPNTGDFFITHRTGKKETFPCGHRDFPKYRISAFGATILQNLGLPNGQCGECLLHELKPKVIQCCLCGSPILPQHPIRLCPIGVDDKDGVKATITPGKDPKKIACSKCAGHFPQRVLYIWNGEEAEEGF